MSGEYKAAYLQFDITPSVSPANPAYLQGMAGDLRKATAVAVPLSLEMCMLEDDQYKRLIFVAADILGFDPTIVESVRRAALQWGIEPDSIVLNASHTHYAPGTMAVMHKTMGPFYEKYASQIQQIITSNLSHLYDRLEPCSISAGKAEARIGINRRAVKAGKVVFEPNPDGVSINDTPILNISLTSSRKTILWVNHGCHPTGMGTDTRISADYPGVMKKILMRDGTADGVMFFQGAAGTSKEAGHREGAPSFSNSLADVVKNGQCLAAAVKAALGGSLQPITGPFSCTGRRIDLPLKPDETGLAADLSVDIQLIGLGDRLRLLSFPMEPAAELVKTLTQLEGFSSNDFLLGYTNGLNGYLPTDKMIEEGGYETEQSHLVYQAPGALAVGTETRVVDAVKDMLPVSRNAGSVITRPSSGRSNDNQAFFVLSAGRCGTMTLAHLLDTAVNANVWHHPQPDPLKEALQAWWQKIDLASTFWRARRSVIRSSWKKGLIHGETDLLMTPFAQAIAKAIPDSKFIILVRNPADFIRSGMCRNYYQGHAWDIGRLRPEPDTPTYSEWASLNQFEKICWLWNETYRRILRMTDDLPKERLRIVKFEDLISQPETSKALFAFLGLDGFDEGKINAILEKKLNAQTTGHFPPPGDWNEDLRATVDKQCGQLSSYFGYSVPRAQLPGDKKSASAANVSDRRPNLLFLEQLYQSTGGHLDHVVRSLESGYRVKYLKTLDIKKAREAIQWADIVWLEWANQMTAQATNNIPEIRDKKVVCRLHGYEVFTDMPARINWNRVHRLVFVAEHKKRIFQEKFGQKKLKQIVIRNGVDVEGFSIAPDKSNTKKLVLLGHLNFRKGLPMLLHFYQQLLTRDPSFYLFIRGEFQDPRLEMAARTMIKEMDLTDKIEFVDWVDDLNAWLADKSHILSFSLEESFHYAIGNGMAAGLKPVIHAWNESRDIWPNEFIFKNLDQFLSLATDDAFHPGHYRQRLFDLGLTAKRQIDEIQYMLGEVVNLDGGASKGMGAEEQPLAPSNYSDAAVKAETEMQIATDAQIDNALVDHHVRSRPRRSDYSNQNAVGLWLHRDEAIQPYMDLEYVLKIKEKTVKDADLIFFLQDAFHRMCTSYFNYGQIAPNDYNVARLVIERLQQGSAADHTMKVDNKEDLLINLFWMLKDRLPHARHATSIEIKKAFQNADSGNGESDIKVLKIFRCLQSAFHELLTRNMVSLFVVHGSMSTLDYTRFSDIDTQVFLTDEVFSTKANVEKSARTISNAVQYLKFFDPLQHHGYFIATDMDRSSYPQAYLPFETLACSTILHGEKKQTFWERASQYENQVAMWNIAYFFRKSSLDNYIPATPFDMKRYLSRFSMLPVLFMELFHNIYPYKREAFALAKAYFTPEQWDAYETVSQVRRRWNPAKTIRFGQRFYDQVRSVAEMMLAHLREQADE